MANRLELTWYGKDESIHIEPRATYATTIRNIMESFVRMREYLD